MSILSTNGSKYLVHAREGYIRGVSIYYIYMLLDVIPGKQGPRGPGIRGVLDVIPGEWVPLERGSW